MQTVWDYILKEKKFNYWFTYVITVLSSQKRDFRITIAAFNLHYLLHWWMETCKEWCNLISFHGTRNNTRKFLVVKVFILSQQNAFNDYYNHAFSFFSNVYLVVWAELFGRIWCVLRFRQVRCSFSGYVSWLVCFIITT